MKPYIAINASALIKRNKTGVEWYVWQLLKYLAREWKESDPPIVLFAPKKLVSSSDLQNIPFLKKNWHLKLLKGNFLWTQYHLLKFLKRYPPLVLFSPSYISPYFLPKNIPTVNVVHGLEGEYFPEFKTIKQIIAEYYWVVPVLKKSTRLIAVSEHTKKDLNYFYHIPLAQIKTVLSGPGTLENDEIGNLSLRKSTKLIKFLFLGGFRERKNLITALKIFLELKKLTKKNTQLLIAGNISKNNPIVNNLIKLGEKNIVLLGYISEAEKKRQLKSAHFLLYPSFYEGFGFPVLEAQAFGAIPVVLKGSGLNEVGGRGIIELAPPSKNKSLGIELMKIIEDPVKQKSLRQLGLENAQKFSWQSCAREVRKILLNFSIKG
ncbi:MAG: glycosyltransferase family 1 protein [Candidatus Moraniibacteriota bacterium]